MNLNTNADSPDLSDDALLASMLGNGEEILDDDPDAAAIAAAVAEIERAEVPASDATDAEPVTAAATPAPKPEKGKKGSKKAAAPKEPKEPKPEAPKEPKAPRVTYVTGNVSDVLKARMGDKLNEFLILEPEDAALPSEELQAKQAELLALLNKRPGTSEGGSTQKKVAEKVVMLFGWIKNGGKLNEVMERTFKVLARDGKITTGDKGNLHAELLAKPYSVGTARAQAGQMASMLPMLKVVTKSEKGCMELNPNSMIFAAVKGQLGL